MPAPTGSRWQRQRYQCYYIEETLTLDFRGSVFPDKTGSPLTLPRAGVGTRHRRFYRVPKKGSAVLSGIIIAVGS
ncbi:hypothetical protein [Kamptonema formosum]|uniref:hypothetical protein n=1 Tax=Kamptonema formosum TaxID=331992 RepID=UPI00034C1029|nr:hypothetical protein [Oscillatoria sp. PCC 10802]